jgi:hypothetical protein
MQDSRGRCRQGGRTLIVEDYLKHAVAPAATSVGTSMLSFFASTLPVVQWLSAAVAVVSGLFAIVWVGIQIRDRISKK